MQLNAMQIANFEKLSEKFKQYTSCANKLDKKDSLFFVCLDCSLDRSLAQCETCFNHSHNHLNHKYYSVKKPIDRMCACGTSRNQLSNYACSNHVLKGIIEDSVEANQLYLNDLDHTLRSKIDHYFQSYITSILPNE